MRIFVHSRWWRFCLGLLLVTGPAAAQMTPDAPLRNFSFPVFAEDGYKIWELQGVEGRYISESESVILGLDLKTFSGDDRMVLENRLRSPRARVFLDQARAEGESSLFFSGDHFTLQGEHWSWDGKTRTLRVRSRARVVLNDSINILK